MATLKSVATEQQVTTPNVVQAFSLLAVLARRLREEPTTDRKE